MDNLSSWNIRGLNWPNKQEESKLFLHSNHIGLVDLLETKVKLHKVDKIAGSLFLGWQWVHNYTANIHGQIWVAWHPRFYALEVLLITERLIHGKATQLGMQRAFFVTFVYLSLIHI